MRTRSVISHASLVDYGQWAEWFRLCLEDQASKERRCSLHCVADSGAVRYYTYIMIIFLLQKLAEYENEPHSVKIGEKGTYTSLCCGHLGQNCLFFLTEILRDGFEEKPCFQVLVAEWTSDDGPTLDTAVDPEQPSSSMPHDDRIVGYALYFYSYSTWEGKCLYIEDICVREEYQSEYMCVCVACIYVVA